MGPHGRRLALIVDEESAIRTSLKAVLQGKQFDCLEAENVGQALRLLRHPDSRIDLIIIDIRMVWDVNGEELAYTVHNLNPALPVILISGEAHQDIGFISTRNASWMEEILRAVGARFSMPDEREDCGGRRPEIEMVPDSRKKITWKKR